MRAYWELAAGGFRRYSRYRAAIAAALFTNTVFGFIRASLLITTITTAGRAVGGYDLRLASTYVWLGQGLLGAIAIWGSIEVAQRVKSGEIAIDLLRPVSALGQWWAADLGRALAQLFPRLLPLLAVGALTTGLALPASGWTYPLFALSLVLGVSAAFLAWLLVNLLALWVVEVRGFANLFSLVASLLSGLLVPVTWFPDWLRRIAEFSPFPSMFQIPVDVFLGLAGPGHVAIQAGWVLALAASAQLMLVRGARRVVITGG